MTQASADRVSWTRPGAFQEADRVFRIPTPLPEDGLRAVNIYAIESAAGLTLVDSGLALSGSERHLEYGLNEIGYGLDSVTRFLITHVHRDHYTQAIALREKFGWPVALGRGEQPTLDVLARTAAERSKENLAELRRCGAFDIIDAILPLWDADDLDQSLYVYPDQWLEPDTSVALGDRQLDVIETPGHTRGHVVFRDSSAALLFAGDHVLPHITPSIGLEAAPAASPLADYLHSLRLIRELPDTMLLPAHGPVQPSTHQRVDELLEHHRVRLDQVFNAVADGADNARSAAGVVRWTRRERHLDELTLFDQVLAVGETSAHLKVLAATGRLITTEGPVWTYRPSD